MRSVCVALFAGMLGCAFVQPASAVEAAKAKEKVLHSFGSGTDGQSPIGGLIDVKGTLYGTTYKGGASGGGAIFALDPKTGMETVLYSFCSQQNCTDGEEPVASLIDVKGMLYGTTTAGGASSNGTVFSVNPTTGSEKVVYSFCSQQNCTDGAFPQATLISVKGILYGTTGTGGANGSGGTVFALDPNSGTEKMLYSFCSQQNCTDGQGPDAGVTEISGVLYGTTGGGGSTGNGTVYSFDSNSSTEKTLYSFCSQQNCADGAFPYATLISVKGTLYSTTVYGGSSTYHNHGTLFALDPSTGAERVVYSFCSQQNCADGIMPYASLIDVNGTFYGTTYGGDKGTCGGYACGTVFAFSPNTGVEKVVYPFCKKQNCIDGDGPVAALIAVNGTLYGTTSAGGAYGYGTVFALKR